MGQRLINLHDYESLARELLPAMVFDYFAGGAQDEQAVRENLAAFERLRFRYRVLAGVGTRSLETRVLGSRVTMPVLIAPLAFQRLADRDGERGAVQAASVAGTIFILSTLSTVPVEEVVSLSTSPVWFQLYIYKDRTLTASLVHRVERAGCKALVLTVDAPVLGRRERDLRNGFHLPAGIEPANLHGVARAFDRKEGQSALAEHFESLLEPNLSWDDVYWLRSLTSLPIVLKGVVRVDDALRARDEGVAGIIVSNHGGRQLDSAISPMEALPAIVDAVGRNVEILVDGGVRRGGDVLKALALGARAVLLGRPVLWGLAVDGRNGVASVLELLRSEISETLALVGCRSLDELSRDLLVRTS